MCHGILQRLSGDSGSNITIWGIYVQGQENLFKIGCAIYNIRPKNMCAKPRFSLLLIQILGAQMRTLRIRFSRPCSGCSILLGSSPFGAAKEDNVVERILVCQDPNKLQGLGTPNTR